MKGFSRIMILGSPIFIYIKWVKGDNIVAKRLNYEIGFTADTSGLRNSLKQVQNDLSKISLG